MHAMKACRSWAVHGALCCSAGVPGQSEYNRPCKEMEVTFCLCKLQSCNRRKELVRPNQQGGVAMAPYLNIQRKCATKVCNVTVPDEVGMVQAGCNSNFVHSAAIRADI